MGFTGLLGLYRAFKGFDEVSILQRVLYGCVRLESYLKEKGFLTIVVPMVRIP